MRILAGLLIVAVLFVVAGLWARRRRRKKKFFQKLGKHPTGFKKYHLKTETRLKACWSDDDAHSSDSKTDDRKDIAVIHFKGDLKASARLGLSQIVDELILNSDRIAEVVICVESPGGMVAEYGHAFSELKRIREAKLQLTVCIDTVAASGGYLMSLPAHKILAAPFAMVGSIGVVSFVPNIKKLLERFDIMPRTFTAGAYKRTVTLTDDNDPETVDHYKKQLALIHDQFKAALKEFRPHVDLDKVATGEAWLAQNSVNLNLGLVDEIKDSATYLLEKNRSAALVEFKVKSEERGLRRFIKADLAKGILESML
jgi:serine protease SohB